MPHPDGPTSATISRDSQCELDIAEDRQFTLIGMKDLALDLKPQHHLCHRVAQCSNGCTHDPFDRLRDQNERERIGKDHRDIEQLKIDLDLKADAVAAAEQLDHQDDLPYQCQSGARCGKGVRRELRHYNVSQRVPSRHAEASGHLRQSRVEGACALTHGNRGIRQLVQRDGGNGGGLVETEPHIEQHDQHKCRQVEQYRYNIVQP